MLTVYLDESGHESGEWVLSILGPIPTDCGLKRVIGTPAKKLNTAYYTCLLPLILSIIQVVRDDERIEFVFEQQDRYSESTNDLFNALSTASEHVDELWQFQTSGGLPKIAKWGFVPKGSTILLEPAGLLALFCISATERPDFFKVQMVRANQNRKRK